MLVREIRETTLVMAFDGVAYCDAAPEIAAGGKFVVEHVLPGNHTTQSLRHLLYSRGKLDFNDVQLGLMGGAGFTDQMKFDLLDQYGYKGGMRLFIPEYELEKAMEELMTWSRQFHLEHKGLG